MPALFPFRALRYAADRYPDLTPVLAPPFDEVDEARRERLEGRDPHNAVRLEREGARPGDAGPENRYRRSARWLREWIAAGVLVRDDRPALWIGEQRFEVEGRPAVRRGFFARLRLHPFEDGVVLPHQRTAEEPWRDRLALYQAVRASVSPVHVLYPDDGDRLRKLLEPATARAPDLHGRTPEDGTLHRLWRLDDPALTAEVERTLAPLRVTVADGHHRYVSALHYARWCEETLGAKGDGAHRTILACFTGMDDPGLVLRPTHRLVRGLPALRPDRLFTLLDEHFEIEALAVDPTGAAGRAWALRRLAEAGRTSHAVLALAGDRKLRLLVLKEGIDLAHVAALPKNPTLRSLDVELVDGLVLANTLGIDPYAPGADEHLLYERDPEEAFRRVLAGEAEAAFLLNPTAPWQVRAVQEAGQVMPKSSFAYFPRLPTGLLLAGTDPADPL